MVGADEGIEHNNSRINITGNTTVSSNSNMASYISLNNSATCLLRQNGDSSAIAINSLNQALLAIPRTFIRDLRDGSDDAVFNNIERDIDMNFLNTFRCYPEKIYDEGMYVFSHPIYIPLECKDIKIAEATIYFNIGFAHSRMKDDDEALLWFNKALNLISECNSKDLHRSFENCEAGDAIHTNTILHNIGHAHWRAGRYDVSICVYTQALELLAGKLKNLEALQEQKPSALNIMCYISANLNCIAVSRFHAKDENRFPSGETLDLLTRAFSIHNNATSFKEIKVISRASATILNNIGRVKFARGDFVGALLVYKETCCHRKAVLGKDHLDVAVTHYNIAETQKHLNSNFEAVENYETFYNIAQKWLGRDHADVACVLATIGRLHQSMNDLDAAMHYLTMAVASSRLAFGVHHEFVAFVLNQLGNAAVRSGFLDTALETYEAGLDIEESLQNCGDKVIVTLLNIANVSKMQDNYEGALRRYSEALAYLNDQDTKRFEVAEVLTSICFIYELQGKYSLAAAKLRQSIKIRKELCGSQSFDVSSALNALGLIQFKQNDVAGALESFLEALTIRWSLPEANINTISTVCNNVAAAYQQTGEIDKALHFYKKTLLLEIEDSMASAPFNILICLRQIASLYKQKNAYFEALEYYEKAVRVCAENREDLELQDVLKATKDLHSHKEFMLLLHDNTQISDSRPSCAPAA